MSVRTEMLERLRETMLELFEIEPERVTEDARLYEDLDLDSIDAVDLVIRLQELTGRKFQQAEFKSVRTVGDALALIEGMLTS